MPVDISDILHVLAHELRTPVGIAHGYVRLLLEDRLPQEGDRHRALEQMQKALVRLSELSNETTDLATWYEQASTAGDERVDARALLNRVSTAAYEWPVTVNIAEITDGVAIRTRDGRLLGNALVDVVRATARELRGQPCTVTARVENHHLELLAGPSDRLSTLGAGPEGPDAGPLSLERGGLGLTLVHAAVVLDAHGAERWGVKGSRHTAGIRLPVEERPLP